MTYEVFTNIKKINKVSKKIIILCSLCFLYSCLFSQVITRRGNTEWIQAQGKIHAKNKITKHTISQEIINKKVKKYRKDSLKGIGINIETDLSITNSGNWETINDTLDIWTLEIESKKAKNLFLVFDEFEIPKGDELYIYNPSKTILMGPFTSINNPDGGCYATDEIKDDKLILEYHKYMKTKGEGKISISRIIYGVSPDTTTTKSYSADCFIDVNCDEGDGWDDQKNGTCMLLVLGSCSSPNTTGSAWSSASLINNTSEDYTPYIITAEHCVEGTGEDVSEMIFRFKYWNNDCGSNLNTSTISFCGGQVLEHWLNDTTYNDIALIEMYESPKSENSIFYCGWNRSTTVPDSSTVLSHPDGLPMKITRSDNVISYNSRYWTSYWYIGGLWGKSSGAPLFDENKLIIGIHHERYFDYDCESEAFAGKLSFCWNNNGYGSNGSDGKKISEWLDPTNTGATSLDGMYCGVDAYVNVTFDADTTLSGCTIYMEDVSIEDSAKVTIDIADQLYIDSDFEIELGSELEVE